MTVENYVGMNVNSVRNMLKDANISYEIIGNGDTVISHTPSIGDVVTKELSKIIIYTTKEQSDLVTVPNLVGLSGNEGIAMAINAGLSIKISGVGNNMLGVSDIIFEQSLPPGEEVRRGSVITIRLLHTDHND